MQRSVLTARLLTALLAAATGSAALAVVLHTTAPSGTRVEETLVLALVLGSALAILAWGGRYPVRATPLRTVGIARLAATHLSAAVVGAAAWLALAFLAARGLGAVLGDAQASSRAAARAPLLFSLALLVYLLAVAIHYLVDAAVEARRADAREAEVRVFAREAELRALRQQVSPHFLFNCLNTISALVSSDPGAARRGCLELAELLRATLRLGARDQSVALSAELALADSYLALEGLRFGDRLRVDRSIGPETLAAEVPALVLLPLVENAVTHGVAERLEGGVVALRSRRRGDILELEVENPRGEAAGSRRRSGSGGFGLDGLRRRLAALHGDGAAVWARADEDVFLVRVSLPFRETPAR